MPARTCSHTKQHMEQITQCITPTKSGLPCKAKVVDPTGYCVYHSPLYADKQKAIRILGGSQPKRALKVSRNNTFRVRGTSDIAKVAAKFVEDISNGKLNVNATTIRILPQMMKVYMEAAKDMYGKRIEKLEEKLRETQSKK